MPLLPRDGASLDERRTTTNIVVPGELVFDSLRDLSHYPPARDVRSTRWVVRGGLTPSSPCGSTRDPYFSKAEFDVQDGAGTFTGVSAWAPLYGE